MKGKYIIAIEGLGGQGKSTVIKSVINLLKNLDDIIVDTLIENGDTKVIVFYNGIKIGIESQGDPKSRLKVSLSDFISQDCDIIVCATRRRGTTKTIVRRAASNIYDTIWTSNYKCKGRIENLLNQEYSQNIFNLLESLIKLK